MTDSLRDQLLGLGFKPPAPAPERPRPPARGPAPGGRRHDGKPADGMRTEGKRTEGKRNDSARGDGRRADAGAPGAAARPGGRRDGRPTPSDPRPPGGRPPRGPQGGRGRPREDIDLAKAYAIRAQREKDERIAAEQAKQEEARQRREARARADALVDGRALNDTAADIARHFEYGGKIKRVHVTADQLRALNAGEIGVVQQKGRYLLVAADVLAQVEAAFPPAVALRVDPAAPAGDDPYADPRFQVPDDLVW